MQKIISGVIFLSHIIFPSLAVADSLVQAEADVLIYEIDSQLSYSDYLAKVESADQSNGSRTLGLSYLKIATEIQSGLSSSFYFVLRPDVGTDRNSAGESTVTREFDSRIGTVHRAAPQSIY